MVSILVPVGPGNSIAVAPNNSIDLRFLELLRSENRLIDYPAPFLAKPVPEFAFSSSRPFPSHTAAEVLP